MMLHPSGSEYLYVGRIFLRISNLLTSGSFAPDKIVQSNVHTLRPALKLQNISSRLANKKKTAGDLTLRLLGLKSTKNGVVDECCLGN